MFILLKDKGDIIMETRLSGKFEKNGTTITKVIQIIVKMKNG
jgi:hypothetical protein